MGVRYQKYRSIAIPLNIGIELSQVSRYFDIFGIEPALVPLKSRKVYSVLLNVKMATVDECEAIVYLRMDGNLFRCSAL